MNNRTKLFRQAKNTLVPKRTIPFAVVTPSADANVFLAELFVAELVFVMKSINFV